MEEYQATLSNLKEHLAKLPQLMASRPSEVLSLYLAAMELIVNSVLIREEGVQRPIYYVRHILTGPKLCYPPIEKLAFALVLPARKLYLYFQAYTIQVIIDQSLRQVLARLEMSRRLLWWSIELGEFDLLYALRATIKAQTLANFISELVSRTKSMRKFDPCGHSLSID